MRRQQPLPGQMDSGLRIRPALGKQVAIRTALTIQSGIKEKFDFGIGFTMLDLRQVFSVTDFLRNHKELIARVTETRKPVVLTVKGKPALVIQDAESYQDLMDLLVALKGEATHG